MTSAKTIGIGVASALLLGLLVVPGAQAAAASCNYSTVVLNSASCSGSRAYNCPGPSQCWVGTYCQVTGTGLLGCQGPLGASCSYTLDGCTAYGGTYVGPGTVWGTSGTIFFSCFTNGVGNAVHLSCD